MSKIIRTEGILTQKQYEDIKKFLGSNGMVKFSPIYISLKIKNKIDTSLTMTIEPKINSKIVSFIIKYNERIIFKKTCLWTEDILGLIWIKRPKYLLLINIDREHSNDKDNYYKEKFTTLRYKVCFEKGTYIYNLIMYLDFSNEKELMFSSYCLLDGLKNLNGIKIFYLEIFNLYKEKLNYIGYNIEDFFEQDTDYSLIGVFQSINKLNFSKEILKYFIGYIAFVDKNFKSLNEITLCPFEKLCLKYYLLC